VPPRQSSARTRGLAWRSTCSISRHVGREVSWLMVECVLVVVGRRLTAKGKAWLAGHRHETHSCASSGAWQGGGAANPKAAHQGDRPIDGATHMSCKVGVGAAIGSSWAQAHAKTVVGPVCKAYVARQNPTNKGVGPRYVSFASWNVLIAVCVSV
jgi:hypothetical protein